MENEKKLKFNPDDMIAAADEQFLEWMKNGRYAELIEPIEKIASIVKNCVGHAESGKPAEKLPQQSPPDSQT